jgi:hypothetical protein
MARMSIYVPDELKERMDAVDSVNWSAVAQSQFERELRLHPQLSENEMQATIERLKASKIAQTDEVIAKGAEAGKKWAMERASFLDLTHAGKQLDVPPWKSNSDSLRNFPDDLPSGDSFFLISSDYITLSSDKYFEHGFCLGALEVWKQVKDQLA